MPAFFFDSMQSPELLKEIADAVRLREGPMGVQTVLWSLRWGRPLSTQEWSRSCRLPIPVVAAIRGELVKRGLMEEGRRPRLTPKGEDLLKSIFGASTSVASQCPICEGQGLVIPAGLDSILERFREFCSGRPECDVRLDQSHGTPESGIRRALLAIEKGLILGRHVAFLGDDDLVSVAVALVVQAIGQSTHQTRLLVLDIDERFIEFIRECASRVGTEMELHVYDARNPLPQAVVGSCQTVFTDPPYTVNGITLFCHRAAQLSAREGGDLMLSYADPAPDDLLQIEGNLNRQGWITADLRPGFNRYEGSSIHAHQSNLRHVRRGAGVPHEKETDLCYSSFYTGDIRRPGGRYTCALCETAIEVGPDREYETIADLKKSGCPECGGDTFRKYGETGQFGS
ncbi:MAG TPA: bis-aminopropyl spermidine synthase family protein [bacterium]|nr:bis-aminopropyl spermidine synthase family protein [bacterium]HQO34391.1 bis-aminopropyl spermidine synthase family protein [bacterium]HQQ00879.1 bis-aminopropyl spermidine synthase family protein [bacterium]